MTPETKRVAYRPKEIADLTGISAPQVRKLVGRGVIPRCGQTGDSIVVPAWALDSFQATGEWTHPSYRPEHFTTQNEKASAAVTAEA